VPSPPPRSQLTRAQTAARSFPFCCAPAAAGLLKFWSIIDMMKDPTTGCLLKSSFITLNVKLQRALLHDFDEAEATRHAQLDFDADVGPQRSSCTKEEFLDGLFQLTDLWCETTEVAEYTNFVAKCLAAIVKDMAAERLTFLDDKDITVADGIGSFSREVDEGSTKEGRANGGVSGKGERRRSLTAEGRRFSIMGNEVREEEAAEAADAVERALAAAQRDAAKAADAAERARAAALDRAAASLAGAASDHAGVAAAAAIASSSAGECGKSLSQNGTAHEMGSEDRDDAVSAMSVRLENYALGGPLFDTPSSPKRQGNSSFDMLQASNCDRLTVRTRGRARQLLSRPSMNLQEEQAAPLRQVMLCRLGVAEECVNRPSHEQAANRRPKHELESSHMGAERISLPPVNLASARAGQRPRKTQRVQLRAKLIQRRATAPRLSAAAERRSRAADLHLSAQQDADRRWRRAFGSDGDGSVRHVPPPPLELPQIRRRRGVKLLQE
jgi:hypothetical protein